MATDTTQGARRVTGTVTVDAITDPVTVTGTVAIDAAGLATSAAQATGNTSLATLAGAVAGTEIQVDVLTMPTTAVTGPLTDGQLRATAVPISGTVTANAGSGTLAVSAASLPLPTGASTETTLSTLNSKVTACNTGAVTISGTVPVSGTFWQATQPISGTVTSTDGGAGKTLKSASFSLSATGMAIAGVSTKRLKVYAVKMVVSAALIVNWRDGGTTALEGAQSLAINGGYVESVDPPNFLFATSAGNSLDLVITGVGTAAGRISYWDDDTA